MALELNLDLDYNSTSSSDDEEEIEQNFASPHDSESDDEEEVQLRFGGYEYEFVDEVSDNQKCPVCLLPMRDAVQTSACGHRFCKECLHGILRSDHPVCPNDRLEIQEEGGVHTDECPYEDEECSACEANIQRRLLESHHNDECPKRIIECVHCQDEFAFIEKLEHDYIYCRRFPLLCANSCGHEGIPREEMESHLSKTCPMTEVTCPYAKAGCPFQDIRAHLNDHIEASVDEHLELTWSSLVATKQELDSMKDLRQKFQKVQESNQKLAEAVTDCREEIRDLTLTVKNLEMKNIQQEKQMEGLGRKIKNVESEKLQLTNSWDSEKKIRRLKGTVEVLDVSGANIPHRHARDRVRVSYFSSEGNSCVDNNFD